MSSGLRMHDLCAIAWLARPELFTLQPCFVAVETQGTWTAGTTVVGYRRATGSAGERPGGAGYRHRRVSALGGEEVSALTARSSSLDVQGEKQ
ncbi:hypothetical protein MJ588_04695 [Klebsiella pneumoniae]|nr:hypothetical protein MJ588_04695 [Klebsiella pneumoniae]